MVHVKDVYGDTYSLRGVNVIFISKTKTFDICTQETINFERYIDVNCSSWKQGNYIKANIDLNSVILC